MRLIDIDAFRKDLGLAERCEDCKRDARECQYDQIYTRMDFCGWLDDAEIIDAVPVVRCKDCAKSRPDGDYESVWLWCRRVHGLTRKNDCCPYGERRCDDADQ